MVAMAMTMTAGIWKLLMAAHADVVLNGDEYDYERFATQGAAGRRESSPLIYEGL